MKAFFCVVLAIVAVSAEPESDPNLVYTDGTFHTNAANLAKGIHTGYAAGRVGSLYNTMPVGYNYYNVAPHTVAYSSPLAYRTLGKRDAESEPEADPAYLINPYTAGYAGFNGGYVRPAAYSAGYVSPYASTFGYNAYNTYNPYRTLGKREAESEPEADPAYLINPYTAGFAGYTGGYVRPAAYSAGYISPYASTFGYNAYNTFNPYRTLGKREAEAEADPAYLINPYTAGYAGYTGGYVRPATYSAGYVSPYASTYGYAAASPYGRFW